MPCVDEGCGGELVPFKESIKMVNIKKVKIVNYKCYKGSFVIDLNSGINIIVGNNEAGKSTILEAIHLALTGILYGRYLKNELSQYIFNKEVETKYLQSLHTENPEPLPNIVVEIYFSGTDLAEFEGDSNTAREKDCGISFKIEFDSLYQADYEKLIQTKITTIPVEFYKITWTTFAREAITVRSIPLKSVLIDSTSTRYQNGSDIYISKIIKDDLSETDIIDLSQSYRKIQTKFNEEQVLVRVNEKIASKTGISTKAVQISTDLSPKNSWESSMMTFLEGIPFHQIGKGEQCLIKTNLALSHSNTAASNLILIEEPENHLSYSAMNQFVRSILDKWNDKQIIITTHSSFIANKLNLKNLILLNNNKRVQRLTFLSNETYEHFEKLPGYETLRLLLCSKALLVEGSSDELIVQRAFMDSNNKKLPIENGVDIISVVKTFERFLEIATKIMKSIAVLADNDGDYENNITQKYRKYQEYTFIKIFADTSNELNSLEPQIVEANKDDLPLLCEILELNKENYTNPESIVTYMKNHKTDCALRIFKSEKSIMYPEYIRQAIEWCSHEQ